MLSSRTYWLTRFMILRMLGIIYAVSFLVAVNQAIPLMGSEGLLPLPYYLEYVSNALGSYSAAYVRLPSLLWLWHSDTALLIFAWTGFILSCIVIAGFANATILTILWMLYLSFVNVGQEWYGYGWEIQLTETGFLAIFLCPLIDMRPFPKHSPPMLVIILFRWLVFRIMIGAGLIKIRGDEIWRNGTALYYQFETQPIPGPFSRWFHFLPKSLLQAGVWFNHCAELIAPWFVFWPTMARRIAGMVIVLFQLTIILSGNLSILNWLTIIPALACFDDRFWSKILPQKLVRQAELAAQRSIPSKPMKVAAWLVTALVVMLSVQPVFNMLSPKQIMNTSFDPLNLVNTYGAFGTVGKERMNVVFEGTMDENTSDSAEWKPYVYKGLPVLTDKRPPQVAPYQLRLDWQMWFASMSVPEEYPWTYNLIWKLLHNDEHAVGLFKENPFPGKPPRYIRAVLYQYQFAKPGNEKKLWWNRRKAGIWIPPYSANDPGLVQILRKQGWVQ